MISIRIFTPLVLGTFAVTAAAAPIQFASPYGTTSQASKTSQNDTLAPSGLTTDPDDFWKRDTFTGQWGGLRDELSDDGITITPIYEAEVFGSFGQSNNGAISDGLIDVALDLDLDRITHGLWQDAVFHANVLDIYGDSLSSKYVGDFSNTSNIAAYNTIRLQEIWLQQNFWDKRASLRVGMLAADSEYFGSDAASLFLNGTFGAFTLFGANFNNAPVYPVAAPAVRLDVAPVSFLDFKAGVFAPDENAEFHNHGTDFGIQGRDGALIALEASYLINQSPNDRGLVGTYKIGGFIQQGDYASWTSQAANALDLSAPLNKGTNWAIYAVGDQQLFTNGEYTIEAFARGGFASSQYSFVNNYFDAGLNFTGFIPGREFDVIGVAAARSGISNHFSNAQVEQGALPLTGETVIELTYKATLTPWWTIQPDLQWVLNPSAVVHSQDAFVIGLRTTVAF
jgi:porin